MQQTSIVNYFNNNEKIITKLLITLIICYPLIFIWQCGDLTDTGLMAYTYDRFFENFQIGQTSSPSFLNDLIGAIWFKIFPNLGIIGLKFLYLAFLYPISYNIYKIVKKLVNTKNLALFGVLCGVIFAQRCFNMVFEKDISCYFFLIVGATFLVNGINKNKYSLVFIAGIFIALAGLCRIPSFLAIVFCTFILIYNFFYKVNDDFKVKFLLFIKNYFYVIAGFIFALLSFLLVLKIFDYYNIYMNGFGIMREISNSSHSPAVLINRILSEFKIFVPCSIVFLIIICINTFLYQLSLFKRNMIYFLLFTSLSIMLILIKDHNFSYAHQIKFYAAAFCFFPLLLSLLNKDKFSLSVIVCLFFTLAQVIGTDTGFFLKLLYGMMALIPLSIAICVHYKNITFRNKIFSTMPYLVTGVIIILAVSIIIRLCCIYNVTQGYKTRIRAVYSIDNPKMKAIWTTQENATHIENLTIAINDNINNKINTLFVYGHQPMFYYLINASPVLNNFWLNNKMHQPQELFTTILSNIKSTNKWPLVVDTKENIMGAEGQVAFHKFLNNNNYYCKIVRPDFNIWLRKK